MLAGVGDVRQEFIRLLHVEGDHIPGGEHYGINVDRKRRGRHDRGVPRSHQGQTQMAETFLRADAGDDFARRFQPHAVQLEIPSRDLPAEVRHPVGHRIAVVAGIVQSLGEFFRNQRVRRVGGVSHSQIDHIHARHALLVFELVDLPEQIGRQPLHAVGHGNAERVVLKRNVGFAAHGSIGLEGKRAGSGNFPFPHRNVNGGLDNRILKSSSKAQSASERFLTVTWLPSLALFEVAPRQPRSGDSI